LNDSLRRLPTTTAMECLLMGCLSFEAVRPGARVGIQRRTAYAG
jgi:hypothetical protein